MRKGIVQLVAIGVVIGVALTLVAVLFQWLPESASEEFDRIQAIYWFVTIISIVIFSLVTAAVVFSVWKWRVPEDDDAGRTADPRSHGPRDRVDGGSRRARDSDRDLQRDRAGAKRRCGHATDGNPGNRPAVRVEVRLLRLRRPPVRRARLADRAGDALHDDRGGRDPLVLGAELRPEDGRGPRYRDRDPRHA